MTPEQLKASILQYAMQGKLVEQRPEEGSAEELYLQIQEEKQKLIKDGKIKKEKPLADISDNEIPFDIPENWIWVRLRNICTKIVDGDHNPPSGVKEQTEFLMLSATNINQDTLVDLEKVRYLTREIFEIENQRTKVEINDIFFTIVGSMGRSCIYKGGYNICFQRSVSVITTAIYPEYVKYVLDAPYIQSFMYCNATGTAQKGFYLNQVENLIIPLPPLNEQHRIVSQIETIIPYVNSYSISYQKLNQLNAQFPEEMKKSILQYAIQGKLVEQRPEEGTAEELYQQIQDEKQRLIKEGKIKKEKPLAEITEDEIPFDIPESWKWVRLPEVGELSRGKSKHRPRNDSCLYEGGGYPFIQTGDVAQTDFKISKWTTEYNEKGLAQSRLWEKGTLCLTIAANIGDVAILDFDACFPDSVVGFNAYKPICNNKFFLYGLMCYKAIFDKMSHSTAQKNINLDILSNVAFPFPPIQEQMRIVDKIEELLPYCDRLVK